jgi:hypothetical protein
MIATVSLRLLYLIFLQMLRLALLLGRRTSAKDVELVVATARGRSAAPPQPETPPEPG